MVKKILSASFTGTTVMTGFSYFLSGKVNKQFKEPVLLNNLLSNSSFFASVNPKSPAGWFLHYSIGALFSTGSHLFWKLTNRNPSIKNGSLLGFIYGIMGITGWHLLLLSHSNPPSIDLKRFYLHLLAAHIIFGLGSATGYRLLYR